MVVHSKIPFIKLISELFVHLIPILIYIGIISALDYQYHLEDFHFPLTIVAVLGTVIGLLLAFRTNSSYDRWWEARTLWGAIVNDSRTWTRQLLEFTPSEAAVDGVPSASNKFTDLSGDELDFEVLAVEELFLFDVIFKNRCNLFFL